MEDGQILKDVDKIAHLPISIVQGRYDVVCPAITSWELYKALGGKENPKLQYTVIDDAGHSAFEEGIKEKLVQYADMMKTLN